MANPEHIKILGQGVDIWNRWRAENPEIRPDLSLADLCGAQLLQALGPRGLSSGRELYARTLAGNYVGLNLYQTDLTGALLRGANLRQALLHRATLSGADLSGACLVSALCVLADIRGSKLVGANLKGSDLCHARLEDADLSGANLSEANLLQSDMTGANLTGCRVYGISAWDLKLQGANQSDLIITPEGEPEVRVDDVKVAQFVYLLLNNATIRDVIDTVGEKGVLILGRFTEDRKAVLDAIRDRLRALGFVPMMFDFERPTQRDFTETIRTLAGLSRFIIADITNPKSSPLELQATMPDYMIPFVPIIQEDEEPFAMFSDLQHKHRDWCLDVLQ